MCTGGRLKAPRPCLFVLFCVSLCQTKKSDLYDISSQVPQLTSGSGNLTKRDVGGTCIRGLQSLHREYFSRESRFLRSLALFKGSRY